MSYEIRQTRERVAGVEPAFVTRFFWRAQRRCNDLNRLRMMRFYRFEVHKVGRKYEVVAMQNVAEPK